MNKYRFLNFLLPLIFIVPILMTTACPPPKEDVFITSIKDYNNNLRWKRFEGASSYLPPDLRGDFLEDMEKDAENLNITDFEIKDIKIDQASGTAVIKVRLTWYKNNEVVEKKGFVTEKWVLHDKNWVMTEMTGDGPWKKKLKKEKDKEEDKEKENKEEKSLDGGTFKPDRNK